MRWVDVIGFLSLSFSFTSLFATLFLSLYLISLISCVFLSASFYFSLSIPIQTLLSLILDKISVSTEPLVPKDLRSHQKRRTLM